MSRMKAIIVSKLDPAGINIANFLLESGFEKTSETFDNEPVYINEELSAKLYFIRSEQIYADYVDKIQADLFIFASKHASKAGIASLTVHPIGNWHKAVFGGRDFELVKTSACVMKALLLELKKQQEMLKLSDYEVCYEVTHHGPWLSKQAVFIELGSAIQQWNDKKAAKAIANAILNADYSLKCKVALGFGGLHYAPSFTRVALQTEFGLSHMCSKHYLQYLNKEMIEKAIEATAEHIEAFMLDWKGLGAQKEPLLKLLEENFSFRILKSKNVK